MNRSVPTFTAFIIYLTQLVGYCNLFMFFACTADNGYAYIELWPWLMMGVAIFWGLFGFLRQPRTVEQVVAVMVVCTALVLVVMSLFFIHATSWVAWGFAWIFLVATMIQIPNYLLRGCGIQAVVLGCELPVAGIGFMLWMASYGVFYLPTYYIVCTVMILLLNILALAILRIHSVSGGSVDSVGVVGTVLTCFAILGALATAVVQLISAGAATAVETTGGLVVWLYRTVSGAIVTFFQWLGSLLPAPDYGEIDMAPASMVVAEEGMEEMAQIDVRILYGLTAAAGLVIVYLLLKFFLKLRARKLSVGRLGMRYSRPQQQVDQISLWRRLQIFLQKICQRIRFEIAVFFRRNTPQGAVITLLRIGRLRGMERETGESYHSYLLRLALQCAPDDGVLQERFYDLATLLDGALYGTRGTKKVLTATDYQKMRWAAKKMPRQGKVGV